MSEAPKRAEDVCDITIASPYTQLDVGEGLPLYTGPMEIKGGTQTFSGTGTLTLALKGDPRIEFSISSANRVLPAMLNEPDPTIHLPDLKSTGAVHVQRATSALGLSGVASSMGGVLGGAGIEYSKQTAEGKPESIGRVIFHLLNFPDFVGTDTHELARKDLPAGTNHPYRGRAVFEFGKWTVTLDKRRDVADKLKAAHAEHSYTFTHTGTLRRTDGKLFSPEDAKKALEPLSWFFSFARGARCGCVLPTGYRHLEEPLWQWWQSPYTAPARSCNTWFSERTPDKCFRAATAFAERWQDNGKRKWLKLGIGLYCVSNQSGRGNVELQLAESQIALELLTCVAFLEENSLMSEKAFENLSAADKVRVLLFWLGTPTVIPDKYGELNNYIQANKSRMSIADAPEVVTEIRNAIIHPTKSNREKREKIDDVAVYEAWQLNMWYVELALLKLIGYSGPYTNRTLTQFAGSVHPLPWTPTEVYNSLQLKAL